MAQKKWFLFGWLLIATASECFAQKAGDSLFSVGFGSQLALGTASNTTKVTSINLPNSTLGSPGINIYPIDLYQEGFATRLKNFNNAAIWSQNYFTDNISLTSLALTVPFPPQVEIYGQGDLSRYGRVIKLWAINPIISLSYTFGKPTDKFRPFVGPAIVPQIILRPRFINEDFIKEQLGDNAKLNVKWGMAAGMLVGANYWLTDDMFLRGVVAYAPTVSKAKISFDAAKIPDTKALPGLMGKPLPNGEKVHIEVSSPVPSNLLTLHLGLGYRFNLFGASD